VIHSLYIDKYRYYQVRQLPTIAQPAAGALDYLLRVSPDVGEGYLEMWSPNAFCLHTVQKSQDGLTDNITLRTGPASKTGVYLSRGGQVVTQAFLTLANDTANERNGHIEAVSTPPQICARFYPGLKARPKTEQTRAIYLGNAAAGLDGPALTAGTVTRVGFPPMYCKTAAVSSNAAGGACVINIVNQFDGVSRQIRGVNQVPGAYPFAVAPWEFIEATTAPGNDISLSVLWAHNLDVQL